MTARSRSYKEGLHRRLKDNAEAANYLQAALEDSQSAFLVALKNVLDSRKVAAVARASELNRVHIHQMLTSEGNPTLSSLEKILHAIGLRLEIGLNPLKGAQRRAKNGSSQQRMRSLRAALIEGERSGIAEGDVIGEVRRHIRARAPAGT
ncbi:MAG TPA: hypothetical protein VMI06_03125 [Terriglobia bacterium]|nr:hypothetical protein [Terriglobia bacterium]